MLRLNTSKKLLIIKFDILCKTQAYAFSSMERECSVSILPQIDTRSTAEHSCLRMEKITQREASQVVSSTNIVWSLSK